MNCFVHDRTVAVAVCPVCQKAMCRACVGRETPRLVCLSCTERRPVLGYEYRSSAAIGRWPLVHVCIGMDAVTLRPRIARGVIAIGNISVGGIAVGGVSAGLIAVGGLSVGLVAALGGVALGLGLSIGGVAVGGAAIGGLAIGYVFALGGAAFGPAVVDGLRCDEAARELINRLSAGLLPPSCRGR